MSKLTSTRDMDLVRQILLEIEQRPPFDEDLDLLPQWIGGPPEVIWYHVMLLDQAGLIEARPRANMWVPTNLTWEGHEFLDAARDETIWKEAKKSSVDKLASISFAVLQKLLTELTLQALSIG